MTLPPGLIVCGDRLPRTALRLYGVTHILPHTWQISCLIIVCINYFYIELTLINKPTDKYFGTINDLFIKRPGIQNFGLFV